MHPLPPLPPKGLHLEEKPFNGSVNTVLLNLVYTSLTFASFVLSIPALLLTILAYRTIRTTATVTARHTEQLFVLASVVLSLVTFFDSFQWAYLLGPRSVVCTLVGAIHEYATVTLLVFGACGGVHLIIVTRRLKCLMVIDELKRRRYMRLVMVFTLATFLLPFIFVLGPIITQSYGQYDYKCWLKRDYTASSPNLVEEVLVMHVWGVLVSVFVMVAVSYAYVTLYCRSSRLTRHVCVVALGMAGFPIVTALNVAVYVAIATHLVERIEPLLYVTAIWTPLQFILADLALVSRSCITVCVHIRRRQYTPIRESRQPPDKNAQNAVTARVLPQCSADEETSRD